MRKYSLSFKNMENPYAFLAELIIFQALYDIECYYNQKGSIEEIQSGYDAVLWIKRMGHYFQLYASATKRPIEEFHQWCLAEIVRIKEDARARRELEQKNNEGTVRGNHVMQMVPG